MYDVGYPRGEIVIVCYLLNYFHIEKDLTIENELGLVTWKLMLSSDKGL